MIEDVLTQLAASAWALPLLFAVVLGDAFLVVVPGEAAVTAYGALAITEGSPPLAAIIAVAASAAALGDISCYLIGRRVGLERWRWMRTDRFRTVSAWAQERLNRRAAVVVFTARFIPFARLAVNLVAGAVRIPAGRYVAVVMVAATGWALYQALVGAVVASIIPGGAVPAVLVSIALAVVLGLILDALFARRPRGR